MLDGSGFDSGVLGRLCRISYLCHSRHDLAVCNARVRYFLGYDNDVKMLDTAEDRL